MATLLLKPVRRQMLVSVEKGKFDSVPVIVSILPGDVIEFRIKGTQQRIDCSLHNVYRLAQLITWKKRHDDKLKAYELKRKNGGRGKRPRWTPPPFHKFIYEATK